MFVRASLAPVITIELLRAVDSPICQLFDSIFRHAHAHPRGNYYSSQCSTFVIVELPKDLMAQYSVTDPREISSGSFRCPRMLLSHHIYQRMTQGTPRSEESFAKAMSHMNDCEQLLLFHVASKLANRK
jgi:hypothetical protein